MSIIQVLDGDILNIQKGIIIHGVSCQGVMGSGVALAIKNKYIKVYTDYLKTCLSIECKTKLLGNIIYTSIKPDLIIVSGFTQEYYGRDRDVVYVNYFAIESVFKKVNELSLATDLPVYYPMIGAGLGNGNWDTIKDIITKNLTKDSTLVMYNEGI